MGFTIDGKGNRQKPVNAELNLVPYIDLLTCMVAFLLITAVWTQLASLSVSQKGPGTDSDTLPVADEKVAVGGSPDDLERVEGVVLEVGEGILGQDFEPRPSPTVCSWCDYRLICPASEA